MFKKPAVTLLSILLILASCSPVLADDDVTIPCNKRALAGSSLPKEDAKAEPVLDIYSITPGTTIIFWMYRNGHAQVSPTYTFSVGEDLPIKYNNSGNKVKNEKYHSVWKKTTQGLSTETKIHFAFIP